MVEVLEEGYDTLFIDFQKLITGSWKIIRTKIEKVEKFIANLHDKI